MASIKDYLNKRFGGNGNNKYKRNKDGVLVNSKGRVLDFSSTKVNLEEYTTSEDYLKRLELQLDIQRKKQEIERKTREYIAVQTWLETRKDQILYQERKKEYNLSNNTKKMKDKRRKAKESKSIEMTEEEIIAHNRETMCIDVPINEIDIDK